LVKPRTKYQSLSCCIQKNPVFRRSLPRRCLAGWFVVAETARPKPLWISPWFRVCLASGPPLCPSE
jgi:hypothetical protein